VTELDEGSSKHLTESLHIPLTVETPSLVVDLARVQANLDDMANFTRSQGVHLVPHVKTHRTPQFAQMQVDSGADALCIAKLSEAESFASAGFTNLVMAYPIVGADKIARAVRLVSSGVSLRLTTDDLLAGRRLGEGFAEAGLVADLTIKVDTGFHRVGLPAKPAVRLARELAAVDGLRIRGFITHEGHAAGADDSCGLHDLSLETGQLMMWAADEARREGLAIDVVSVGSTATARHTTLVDGITEVRPGIYPFNDYGQVIRGTVGVDRCAARVVATVVSAVAPGRAIIDAGSKSLGQDLLAVWFADGPSGHGLVADRPGWKLNKVSEEHGWMQWDGAGGPTPLAVGERVQIIPNHICSAFHVLGECVVIRDGVVEGTWTATARGCSK
jgi:D-serine deaminase-like pyridoxal phosphate-dependent protein